MTIALDRDPTEFVLPRGKALARIMLLLGFLAYGALLAAGCWALSRLVPDDPGRARRSSSQYP